jgi:hypothetical protein
MVAYYSSEIGSLNQKAPRMYIDSDFGIFGRYTELQLGVSRKWWDVARIDTTGREMLTWGSPMRWVLRLIETGMPSGVAGVDAMEISRRDGASNIADLGLTLSEAKQLLARVQQAIVAAQVGDLAARWPECSSCSGRCHVNGRRCHLLATPFGKVTAQLPRFRCVSCGHIERCVTWTSHCRSTPELDRLRAHLSALMPFRVAADVLTHLLPADAGMSPEALRAHTLKIGEQRCDIPTDQPVAAAMSITVTTDSTFIRSCEEGIRHLEVRVGNVETSDGGRQVFGAVAGSDTDIAVQIHRSLEAVGRTAATKVTAFTDGRLGRHDPGAAMAFIARATDLLRADLGLSEHHSNGLTDRLV